MGEHSETFGPRLYRRGSVLNMHVDVFSTHIISAIVHLERHGIEQVWPLRILDYNGTEQSVVTDRAGQIVLYESAKVLHGRPQPLNGTEYTNIFFHFRPTGWEDPEQWIAEKRTFWPDGWQRSWDPADTEL